MTSRRIPKVVVSLGTLAVLLAATELGLRAFRPVHFLEPLGLGAQWRTLLRPSTVPGLAYELAPDVEVEIADVQVATSSRGMRDDEPLPDDTPGLLRVAVLGDSVGFGWGVREEQAFPRLLERRLQRDLGASAEPRRVEVLNFSVPGYSTRDEQLVLEHRALAYEPDALVLAYCLNDPEFADRQGLQRAFLARPLWQRSHLLRLVARWFHARRLASAGGDLISMFHEPESPEWRSVEEAFERVAELAAGRGLPVVVAIFPWTSEVGWDGYAHAAVHARVARAAEGHGFLAVDLLPLERAHPAAEVALSPKDFHPSPLGHAIAAEALARVLAPLLRHDPRTRGGLDGLGG